MQIIEKQECCRAARRVTFCKQCREGLCLHSKNSSLKTRTISPPSFRTVLAGEWSASAAMLLDERRVCVRHTGQWCGGRNNQSPDKLRSLHLARSTSVSIIPVLSKRNSGDVITEQLYMNILSLFKLISGASSLFVFGRLRNISPYS